MVAIGETREAGDWWRCHNRSRSSGCIAGGLDVDAGSTGRRWRADPIAGGLGFGDGGSVTGADAVLGRSWEVGGGGRATRWEVVVGRWAALWEVVAGRWATPWEKVVAGGGFVGCGMGG